MPFRYYRPTQELYRMCPLYACIMFHEFTHLLFEVCRRAPDSSSFQNGTEPTKMQTVGCSQEPRFSNRLNLKL